jgi:quinoprotein glucose dehydrogenase
MACGDDARDAEESGGTAVMEDWAHYGGDAGGTRYSNLSQIDRSNVGRLREAWSYRTGDASHDDGSQVAQSGAAPTEGCGRCHTGDSKFETTPILARGRLYLGTPLNRAIALDPVTGSELWRFDPRIATNIERNEGLVSRGVTWWDGIAADSTRCASRVFLATVDARLIALDARDGSPCADFGDNGTVHLDRDVGRVDNGQYGVTSPPVVTRDLVITGSSIGDNRRADLEHGTVRAYDARTGELRWRWDPIPRDSTDPAWKEWSAQSAATTGGANAWAPMSVDLERGLVFVPTGSAAPDFYGGERPGRNDYANSVVALEAATGRVVWHFQVVHHDIWDYDVASQPTLVSLTRDGVQTPAVAVATKMGHIFVLHRETGAPLLPVEERPVPASTVPGEQAWPTQPFPVLPAPLHPVRISEQDAFGVTAEEREACRSQIASLRNDGIFTPPSLEGALEYPGFGGGINWGGVAIEPERQLLITNVMRLPTWVRLAARTSPASGNQLGTPYTMTRGPLVSPRGVPCIQPPWGTIAAIDLASGQVRWERPLGFVPGDRIGSSKDIEGSLNVGGPLVTAGGLIFIAGTMDQQLRALDVETGEELWSARLPAGAHATPMTYNMGGRQFIVIAAGGHARLGTGFGDFVIAFALP